MQGFLFSAAKTGGEIRRMINAGQAAATDLIANCDH
jgi:hypothetical protein